ncbi:MAG: hypothetical protein ACI85N_000746, partial [Gammaproteobacteria bacterium]
PSWLLTCPARTARVSGLSGFVSSVILASSIVIIKALQSQPGISITE